MVARLAYNDRHPFRHRICSDEHFMVALACAPRGALYAAIGDDAAYHQAVDPQPAAYRGVFKDEPDQYSDDQRVVKRMGKAKQLPAADQAGTTHLKQPFSGIAHEKFVM